MVGSSIIKPNKGNASEWEWKLSSTPNNNNNNWTRYRRKKAAALEERKTKTMFITNFPPHMDSQDLRIICGEFGTVADVYLPRQLSKFGKRFALVRFLRVMQDDASELARRLSVISIGYYHLFAAPLTRLHEKKPFYQSQTRRQKCKSYANVVKGMREDRISALPDSLLIEILSRLPSTKEAIKTGTLSKRWQHLWTWLPTLIFDEDQITFPLVDKILSQRRQLKLKKFQVFIYYDTKFESRFNNWLRYAISCNVEELNISCEGVNEIVFDQLFFTTSCFTDLRLEGFTMNPTGAISWNKLMSLSISEATLDEDVIENILSGSPLLETLKLDECYGYRRLNISSKSVKNLVFSRYWTHRDSILSHIIAPNILSLTIQPYLPSWTRTWLNVPSLVEANLDYRCGGGHSTSSIRQEEFLKSFILNLSHVKELIIGASCSKVVSRLEAKGFVFPSNLKFLVDIESDSDESGGSLSFGSYSEDWIDGDSTDSEDWIDGDSTDSEDWIDGDSTDSDDF